MWPLIIFLFSGFIFSFTWPEASTVELGPENVTCGQNRTADSDSFKLSDPKLKEGECYWLIAPNSTKPEPKINLLFEILFLHEYDEVMLYRNFDDAHNDTSRLLEKPIRVQNGSVTVITEEKSLVIKLKGNDTAYTRKFSGQYHSPGCDFAFPPVVQLFNSPICAHNMNSTTAVCQYTYNKDQHMRGTPVFHFEEFNFTTSTVKLEGSTADTQKFTNVPATDFLPLPSSHTMTLTVNLNLPSKEYYRLKMHFVDSNCSQQFEIEESNPAHLKSPVYVLDNGTIVTECRWLIKHKVASNVLGITFNNIEFNSVFDIVAINNGLSELSPPLLQLTTSNQNVTESQAIRTTGQNMWVSFKPLTYASSFEAHVTVHDQGGYYKDNGTISMKPSVAGAIFLLEVDEGKVVILNFTSSSFTFPATVNVYDGFDQSNLLASLHGNVWYPVLSRSSKMMLVTKSFTSGSFQAKFHGEVPGCLHMSTLSDDNYILAQQCNTTCYWVIPPQNTSNSVMMLDIQYISIKEKDQIEIYQLDQSETYITKVTGETKHIPLLAIQPHIGALVKIVQGACEKKTADIVVVGHSSYVPVCGGVFNPVPSQMFQVTSPRYPDTYPVLDICQWNITIAKNNLLHLTFHSLGLAANHCIKIQNSDKKTAEFYGHELPDDLFLNSNSFISFDSSGCKKGQVSKILVSDDGFVINATVADCGAIFDGKKEGEFNTSFANKTFCVWKISVPATDGNAVNIISYTVDKKDKNDNYELHVYDGASVRESEIKNNSAAEIWSRSNCLIFTYRRLNVSKPSSVLVFKYSTISCNSSMQCANKLCMHPDWRCNGENDCGDFSDEANCGSVPIPPETKLYGYTTLAFWLTALFMITVGVLLGIAVPHFYQKYKNGQYRRFGDISVIE